MTNAGVDRLAQVFVELADTLVADFDLVEFLHTLTDAIVELLEVQSAGLMLVDRRGALHPAAATGNVGALKRFEIEHRQGPCIDCFALGSPVTNIDPDEARRRWPDFTALVEEAGYIAVHAIPMRYRGRSIGGVNLYCSTQHLFSTAELGVARALVEVATISLIQQRTIRDKAVLADQLQTALDSRVVIEQAKGVIAERHAMTPSDAFTALRSYAREHGSALAGVATEVVTGTLVLSPTAAGPSTIG